MSAQAIEDYEISGGSDHATRIRAAADHYEELKEATDLAKERRDEAIVAGIDEGGLSPRAAGIQARLCRQRVMAILGGG